MALGRTRGRMSNVAMQRASQQRAMAQRAAAQRSGLRAMPKSPTAPGPMTQQEATQMKVAKELDAAMPKQVAGQMAAFNAAQNKNTQGSFMDYAAQRVMQKTPSLAMPIQGRSSMDAQSMRAMEAAPRAPQKTFSQPVSSSPASMAPPKETAPRAAQVPVPQTQPKPTPDMSAIAAPAVLSPEQRKAVMRGEKVTAPPAMRKGGAVKKKPSYAKGGMVMANCGASMKPQQKRKK